jgi:lysophospholipid acyltransferase
MTCLPFRELPSNDDASTTIAGFTFDSSELSAGRTMLDFLFLRPSQALSVPPDQLKVIFCLLSAYPLSSLYIRLPTGTARHVYSLAVAAFYLLGVLKLYGGVLHLLAASLGTYFIVCFDRRPGRMPWAVFAFTMSHLMFK